LRQEEERTQEAATRGTEELLLLSHLLVAHEAQVRRTAAALRVIVACTHTHTDTHRHVNADRIKLDNPSEKPTNASKDETAIEAQRRT
jgi:hypothetical protein